MRIIKTIMLSIAAVALCFCFYSCSSDGDDGHENNTTVASGKKLMKITDNDGNWISFNYDKQGRVITSVYYRDGQPSYVNSDSYVWSDDKVVVSDCDVELRVVDGMARSGTAFNGKTNVSLLYDSKSRLIYYNFGYDYFGDISWGENGVSQASGFHEGDEFVYSGKTCKGYNPYMAYYVAQPPFEIFALAQPELFGLSDNHLPDCIKSSDSKKVTFSYKYDKDGYLVELIATYYGGYFKYDDGESEIYQYTWE